MWSDSGAVFIRARLRTPLPQEVLDLVPGAALQGYVALPASSDRDLPRLLCVPWRLRARQELVVRGVVVGHVLRLQGTFRGGPSWEVALPECEDARAALDPGDEGAQALVACSSAPWSSFALGGSMMSAPLRPVLVDQQATS